MLDQISKYIKRNGHPIGMLMAEKRDDMAVIAWSLCHKNDIFLKANAKLLTRARLTKARIVKIMGIHKFAKHEYPISIREDIEKFAKRAKAFFKTDKVSIVVVPPPAKINITETECYG